VALNKAEENIKKHGTVSPPVTVIPQYAGDHSRAELASSLANGTPMEVIHNLWPSAQVLIWTGRGQYDQALRIILALADNPPNFPVVNAIMPDWMELAWIYPPAREAMIEIRDRDTRDFEQGKSNPGNWRLPIPDGGARASEEAKASDRFANVCAFMEARRLNDILGETNATYEMCRHIERNNPAQFQAFFYLMEPLLMQHGDYELCLKSIPTGNCRQSATPVWT
jgi:hypothetical protein